MRRLVGGELRRLCARRLVRVLALLALLAIAVAGALTFVNTDDQSDAEVATLRSERQLAQQRFEECMQRQFQQSPGLRPGGQSGVSPVAPQKVCDFRGTQGGDPDDRFELTSFEGIVLGVSAPLAIVGWLIGASSIGADWQSRTITTILTWEPRRRRVLIAKVLACVVFVLLFAAVAQVLLAGALLPSALWHGTTAGADSEWWRSLFGAVGRSGGLIAFATVMGFTVSSIGRNTGAALGLGFAYFVIAENAIGNFWARSRPWLIVGNAIVLVSGENGSGDVGARSVIGAAVYLAVLAAVFLVAASAVFGRRDVA